MTGGPLKGVHSLLSQGRPSPNTSLLNDTAAEPHERPLNKSFDQKDIFREDIKKPQASLKTSSKEFVPKHRKQRSLGSATSLHKSMFVSHEPASHANISFEMPPLSHSFQAPEMLPPQYPSLLAGSLMMPPIHFPTGPPTPMFTMFNHVPGPAPPMGMELTMLTPDMFPPDNLVPLEDPYRASGYLKFFNDEQEYGFIVSDTDKSDVFFHYDDIRRTNLSKEFLRDSKTTFLVQFTFKVLAYFGKYNFSKKAVDVELVKIEPIAM